jgi:hypothetical protein
MWNIVFTESYRQQVTMAATAMASSYTLQTDVRTKPDTMRLGCSGVWSEEGARKERLQDFEPAFGVEHGTAYPICRNLPAISRKRFNTNLKISITIPLGRILSAISGLPFTAPISPVI